MPWTGKVAMPGVASTRCTAARTDSLFTSGGRSTALGMAAVLRPPKGRTSSGGPCAGPEQRPSPWHTTASHRSRIAPCGTYRSLCTRGGCGPNSAGSRFAPAVTIRLYSPLG